MVSLTVSLVVALRHNLSRTLTTLKPVSINSTRRLTLGALIMDHHRRASIENSNSSLCITTITTTIVVNTATMELAAVMATPTLLGTLLYLMVEAGHT